MSGKLTIRKRPRRLKTPQGLSTMHLHVRLMDVAYFFLEDLALQKGTSMARELNDILLMQRLSQLCPFRKGGICKHPPQSGTGD